MDILATHLSQFTIIDQDLGRPWGQFYYIDPKDINKFVKLYFPNITTIQLTNLQPKILYILPHQRLSWQYHYHRQELWYIISGPVGIVKSLTDVETSMITACTGDFISIVSLERHRLVGLDSPSIIAELWWHNDITNPSTELDIVRVQDDFLRDK